MKQQMEAELLFDNPLFRDCAVGELKRQGFDIELLDYVDEYEGVLLSETVWIRVRILSELDDNKFFDEMARLAEQLGGDLYEAGYSISGRA
jgi:hypothetical protein